MADSSERLTLDQPRRVRAVMRLIDAEFGDYREEPDAALRLVADALAVTSRIDAGFTTQAAVVAGFNDTGRDHTTYDVGGLIAGIDDALDRAALHSTSSPSDGGA